MIWPGQGEVYSRQPLLQPPGDPFAVALEMPVLHIPSTLELRITGAQDVGALVTRGPDGHEGRTCSWQLWLVRRDSMMWMMPSSERALWEASSVVSDVFWCSSRPSSGPATGCRWLLRRISVCVRGRRMGDREQAKGGL